MTSAVSIVAAPPTNGDCSSATLERLDSAQGFVFDMDGTLVLGDPSNHGLSPLPGAIAILEWLRESGLPFVVFSFMMIVQFVVVLTVYPETKGVTLEDMQKKLGIA